VIDRLLDLLIRFLEWCTRNHVPPQLTEWEQTRADARLAAALEAAENGEVRRVWRYIKEG